MDGFDDASLTWFWDFLFVICLLLSIVLYFYFRNFFCSQNGCHPYEEDVEKVAIMPNKDLAKFGYKPNMK